MATPPVLRILSGIRVLDISAGVAAPMAAAYLASHGAEVVRVPPVDDWAHTLNADPASVERCLIDASNRGKVIESPVIPRRTARVVDRWLPDIDALVCDWSPERAAEVGVDPVELARRNPGLVLVAVTPCGLAGPQADRPDPESAGCHVDRRAGLPQVPGLRATLERIPVRAGRFVADADAGLEAAVAAVAALVRREETGEGGLVDVSIQKVQLGKV